MLTLEISPQSRPDDAAAGLAAARQPAAHQITHAVVDNIECGFIVCDATGRMLHANRAGWREVDAGRIVRVEDGMLRCAPCCQHALSAAIISATTWHKRQLLRIGEEERRMMVVMPLEVQAMPEPLALVIVGRPALCSLLGLELLSMQHRLTLAEQRVLRALAAKRSARQIAAEGDVALCTVRTQIQSIRDKLGVRNIDELLMMVAQVPPIAAWH